MFQRVEEQDRRRGIDLRDHVHQNRSLRPERGDEGDPPGEFALDQWTQQSLAGQMTIAPGNLFGPRRDRSNPTSMGSSRQKAAPTEWRS